MLGQFKELENIKNTRENIPKVLLWINILMLLFSFEFFSRGYYITQIIINSIFLGSYMIVKKHGAFFTALVSSKKIAKSLNNSLNKYAK